MKPNFALDLSHEGINLLHRSKGGWTLVGSVALDDPDMGGRLEELRRSAAMLESGGFTTKLIIPDSQILYTTVAAPGPDDISREVQIRAALDGLTPYPVGELVFDWRAQGDEARVAVLARETMDEAEGFAAQYKFNPVSFAARPGRGVFSGEPFFGKTRAATQILPPGERIEPDASPVPRNPNAKTLSEETRVDLAGEGPADTDSAPVPEPASTPLPDATEAPDSQATRDILNDDPFAELDQLAAQLSSDEQAGADSAPKAAPKPRRKRKDDAPRVAAPPLAPFPPTPDEAKPTPTPTSRPAPAAPTAPKPRASAEAPAPRPGPAQPAPPVIDDLAEDEAPSNTAKPSGVAFSTSRTAAPTSAPAVEKPANRLSGVAPRIGIAAKDDSAEPSASSAAPSAPAPASTPRVLPPAPELPRDRLRADMAEALAKPLPSAGDAPEPAEKGPGLLSRATAAASTALAERREKKAARQAEAAEAALANSTPPAPTADDTAEPPRRGLLRTRRGRSDEDDQRSREAEALTVFGARKGQTTRERPKYLGLILTLVLVLLMAAVALWSSVLIDDGETSLFNPGQEITTAGTDPATTGTDPDPAATTEPTPEPPATAEVLSPEAAQARYAATGIWQRAPEVPGTPETTRLDALEIAGLSPSVSGRQAATLPGAEVGAAADAALADPVPPPPQGTTFDLDANGLVVPTPDGALSPAGILVYSGKPAAVPPTPPAGLFPEPEVPEATDAALDAAVDAAVAAVDAAAVETAAAVPEATVAAVPEATIAPPLALPGVPNTRPATRPAVIPATPGPVEAPAAETTPEAPTTTDPAAADTPPTDDNASLIRPNPRPGDLPPETDTAAIDTVVDSVIQASLVNATELAVPISLKPSGRPTNFDRIVSSAQDSASDGSQLIAASAVAVAPAAMPTIPTSASVASRATTENALNLRKINLIGIYGSSSSRRALVRLDNGRYVKVEVGDRLDGGKVTSISSSKLTYQKGNRAYTLEVLPLG